jgi:ribonuclease HIII
MFYKNKIKLKKIDNKNNYCEFFVKKNKVDCFFFISSLVVSKLHDHTSPSSPFFFIFNQIMKRGNFRYPNRARLETQAVSSWVYTAWSILKPLELLVHY